jgi:hypothetical protein
MSSNKAQIPVARDGQDGGDSVGGVIDLPGVSAYIASTLRHRPH